MEELDRIGVLGSLSPRATIANRRRTPPPEGALGHIIVRGEEPHATALIPQSRLPLHQLPYHAPVLLFRGDPAEVDAGALDPIGGIRAPMARRRRSAVSRAR